MQEQENKQGQSGQQQEDWKKKEGSQQQEDWQKKQGGQQDMNKQGSGQQPGNMQRDEQKKRAS